MNKAIVTMAISAALAAGALMVAGEAKSAESQIHSFKNKAECNQVAAFTLGMMVTNLDSNPGYQMKDEVVQNFDGEGNAYYFMVGATASVVMSCNDDLELKMVGIKKTPLFISENPEYLVDLMESEGKVIQSSPESGVGESEDRTIYEETGAWYHCTTPSGKVAHVREQGVDLIYTFGRPGKKADIELVKSIDSQMGLKELTFQNGNVDYTMNEDGILFTTNKKDGSTTQIKVTCTVSEGGEYAN